MPLRIKQEVIDMSFPDDLHDFVLRGIVQQLYTNFRVLHSHYLILSQCCFSRFQTDQCHNIHVMNLEKDVMRSSNITSSP